MSLLNKANIITTPTAYSVGKLHSVKPENEIYADFDFARNSSATRVGENGLIQSVAANLPRINYENGIGHLLLEPQRTNLVTYSEAFDNAYWTNAEATTVSANVGVSPDGYTNADKLIPQATSNFHRLARSFTVTTATPYTFSAFVKRAGYDYFLIRTSDAANNNIGYDLLNGTVTYTASGYTSFIESYGNDWYRIGFVRSFTASSITINFRPNPTIISTNALDNFTGDGTSGVYIYGAQLEQGSYSTSYIVSNSGSATTRIAEVCNGSGNASTFNDSEGVLMAQIGALADDLTQRYITISDNSFNNRVILGYSTLSNNIFTQINSGGASQGNISFSTPTTNNNKIAVRYALNNFSLWINGVKRIEDLSGVTPIGLNRIDFSSPSGGSYLYGKTKQIAYFPEALTDSELECLTSWSSFNRMAIDLNYTIQ